jgi:1,4-dihydroxy-2-naphthoyl-CoA hydrolase
MTTSIWTIPPTLQDVNARAKNTLSDHLGIEFIEIGDRHLTARMPIAHFNLQPMGVMHGGSTAALAETVASTAANYCVDRAHKTCVGVELNINHLRAIKEGHVDAIAHPLHIGKTTQVWEIKIYGQAKMLVSAARLTLAVIDIRLA